LSAVSNNDQRTAQEPAMQIETQQKGAIAADFAEQMAALRPMLVNLARRTVRNEAWAEDAVSETLIAALERPEAFEGRAKARTWVVGILKHKLIDQVRRHTRECQLDAHGDDEEPDFDAVTSAAGHDEPAPWGDPLATLARRQFTHHVDSALAKLPAKQSRAFLLYECMERETHEVCRELDVTPNHLGVILHRARNRLREVMAPQWRGATALLA
jgi:RNA polymerase sigma-70 factor (ECF subfamily)